MDDGDFLDVIKRKALGLLGFDEVLEKLFLQNLSYPPFNIRKPSEDKIIIILAVAGFSSSDLSVSLDGIQLVISGKREETERDFVYKGIATRSFQKVFVLGSDMKVTGVDYEHGLLKIYVEKPQITKNRVIIPIKDKSKTREENLLQP